jgi:hypothetical protein
MRSRLLLSTAGIMTVVTGCASAPTAGSTPEPAAERSAVTYPAMHRWTGSFKPTQSYNGAAVASQRQNAYGHVDLTVSPSSPSLTHVMLNVSVPTDPSLGILGWGVHPGPCGSGNPAVLAPAAFPAIQVSTSYRGTVNAQIPFVIPDNGSYHVNVFRGSGTQLSDVLTCADLRRDD